MAGHRWPTARQLTLGVDDARGVGDAVGATVGVAVGLALGETTGVGVAVGTAVGAAVGVGEVPGVGVIDGTLVGVPDGSVVGTLLGIGVGPPTVPMGAGVAPPLLHPARATSMVIASSAYLIAWRLLRIEPGSLQVPKGTGIVSDAGARLTVRSASLG